jgi:hypothetical protein
MIATCQVQASSPESKGNHLYAGKGPFYYSNNPLDPLNKISAQFCPELFQLV